MRVGIHNDIDNSVNRSYISIDSISSSVLFFLCFKAQQCSRYKAAFRSINSASARLYREFIEIFDSNQNLSCDCIGHFIRPTAFFDVGSSPGNRFRAPIANTTRFFTVILAVDTKMHKLLDRFSICYSQRLLPTHFYQVTNI